MSEFIEQRFYLNEEKEGNRIYLTNLDTFLPQASLTVGHQISFEGNHYKIKKVRFEKDDSGNDKAAIIILKEL
jgi:hypothetical protein